MDSRRRTIEVDEDVAVALEKRAAEGSMSVSDMLAADYLSPQQVEISAEDLAELDARSAEWDRDRLGYDGEEVLDWLRDRIADKDAPFPRLRRY